jgi:hypothetical protein
MERNKKMEDKVEEEVDYGYGKDLDYGYGNDSGGIYGYGNLPEEEKPRR